MNTFSLRTLSLSLWVACQRILQEHRRLMAQRAAERRMAMRRPSRAACPMR